MNSFRRKLAALTVLLVTAAGAAAPPLQAGVRDAVQDRYRSRYLNKTFFLKMPLYGARYEVMVRQGGLTPYDTANNRLVFKVGEQVRVVKVEFGGQEIRFEIASIDLSRENQLVYRFPVQLSDDFAQQENFEDALNETFTTAMSNSEIAEAKRAYLRREFTRVMGEMAETTESDRGFVINAVSDEIPDVQRAKQRAERAEQQLEQVRSELADESRRRQQAESQLRSLRQDLSSSEASVDELKTERDELLRRNDQMESELRRLRDSNQRYKDQMEELADSLDVRTNTNADLSRSLSQLNETVDNLKAERDRLDQEVKTVGSELATKTEEADRLSRELAATRRERNRLQNNLRDLTSDKNSLNSRYVEASNAVESFDTAAALSKALSWKAVAESLSGQGPVVRDLFLNEHKLARFEMEEPEEAGRLYAVRVSVDSPNLVAFDEEERRLYGALGEKLTVAADFSTSSPSLTATLAEGERRQSVAPRESAEWKFNFTGSLEEAVQAVLTVNLETVDGRPVALGQQTFQMGAGGLLSLSGQPFSLLWLLAGAALGILLMLPVLFLRSRRPSVVRPSASRRPARPAKKEADKAGESSPKSPSYVPHKKL
ncbi:MAG TPA: hypothetical protein VLU25_22310 [Acidobacteriota bacterium]|nr:hypothetical protein [Acidobacteriota bacterium]